MNRRELLSSIASVAASCGVAGTASVVDAEPRPLLLVLSYPQHLPCEVQAVIRKEWDSMFGDKMLPPLVILSGGATLEAVLDPREKT